MSSHKFLKVDHIYKRLLSEKTYIVVLVMVTMGNIDDYTSSAKDSISLTEIGEKPFTIVSVEKSNYEKQGAEPVPGVKITTQEEWETDKGEKVNKLHTTRRAIVSKLTNENFLEALNGGETFKVKCPLEKVPSKTAGGMAYFDLVAV